MTSDELFLTTLRAINDSGIPYLITSSFASNYYGRSRSTKDAGFIIELGNRSINEIATRLGSDFILNPQMGFETITASHYFRISHRASAFMLEFFLHGENPFAQERFRRRKQVEISGVPAFLPTAEDVIVAKLRWCRHPGRGQDLDDARYVVALQREHLDWPYIESWCDRHGARDLLEQLREETRDPPL